MRNSVVISFLLLFIKSSVCQEPTTDNTISSTAADNTSNSTSTANNTTRTRPVVPRIGGAGKSCDDWDHAGSTATGEELCDEDFIYDEYGCLKMTDKLKEHKGKREFGQKCSVAGGNEESCLLLAPGTEWRWKNFTAPSRHFEIGDCYRRTNLICHGYYNRCYCGTRKNPGEYYQYDKGQHTCVIRPGFPCDNEYDCANGTICSKAIISDDEERNVCNCNLRLQFLQDDKNQERFLLINTTHWDNWFCTYPKTPPVIPPSQRPRFSFNRGTAFVNNGLLQIFILATGTFYQTYNEIFDKRNVGIL